MELVGLIVRVAVVFGLLALTLWFVRRTDAGRRRRGSTQSPVQVLGSTRLGKGSSLALVRIGDAAYALGVTEHNVTLLTRTDLPPDAPAELTGADEQPTDVAWTGNGDRAPTDRDARPSFAAALQTQATLLLQRSRPGSRSTLAPRPAPVKVISPLGVQCAATMPMPETQAAPTGQHTGPERVPRKTPTTRSPSATRRTRTTAADGTATGTTTSGRDATEPVLESPCPPRRRASGAPPARGRTGS